MRNPYSQNFDETDELCIVRTKMELQKVMNFMMTFNIDACPFEYGIAKGVYKILVQKGTLTRAELKEARDAISGVLWTLRLPQFSDINI
jgi:hypothetical protein